MEEKQMRDVKKQNKKWIPFYLAIAQGCLYLCIFLVLWTTQIRKAISNNLAGDPALWDIAVWAIAFVSILPYFILGKFACTRRGAAIALVVLSAWMFAVFGLAGGILGIVRNKKEKIAQPTAEEKQESTETSAVPAETVAPIPEKTAPVLQKTTPVPKKKYKVRLNLGSKSFVLAVIFWALSLCGFILIPISAGVLPQVAPGFAEQAWLPLFLTGLLLFFVAGDIAHLVFNYLDERAPCTSVRVFWWLTLLPYFCTFCFILMMIAIVGMLYKVLTGNYDSKPKGEKIFVVYDNGFERKLKRAEGNELIEGTLFYRYIDDIGDYWLSADERTFYKKRRY